ncbi:hypothetical protein HDU67_006704 [Dinochytrium kinnereticum]|nr:hypothetical protein HDU67_006704 [Dinochytrium kinnereticum]
MRSGKLLFSGNRNDHANLTKTAQTNPLPPRVAISLSTLHLPASLPSPANISPKLWAWLHGPDNRIPVSYLQSDGDYVLPVSTPLDRARDAAVLRRAANETRIMVAGPTLDYQYGADGTLEEMKRRVVAVSAPQHLRDLAQSLASSGVGGPVQQSAAPAADGYGVNLDDLKLPRQARASSRKTLLDRKPVSASTFSPDVKDRLQSSPVRAQQRKSAFTAVATKSTPWFFIQIAELRLNTKLTLQTAQCTIVVGSFVVTSGEMQLTQESKKGYGLVCQPREGFLFNVPFDGNDFPITVHVHEPGNPPTINAADDHPPRARSPSISSLTPSTRSIAMESFRTAFSRLTTGLKRSEGLKHSDSRASLASHCNDKRGGHKQEIGRLEAKWTQTGVEEEAPLRRQMKSSFECGIFAGGREVGVVVLQTGFILDEEYPPKAEIALVEHENYLNFQVNSRMGAYFKRYWVILRGGVLEAYDFEYKLEKPRISSLPLSTHLLTAKPSNPETNCSPNCLELRFQTPREDLMDSIDGERDEVGDGGVVPENVSKWRGSIIDRDEEGDLVYVTAEDKEGMLVWLEAIKKHAARAF